MVERTCYMEQVTELRKKLNAMCGFMAREWIKAEGSEKEARLSDLQDLNESYHHVDEWFNMGAGFYPEDFEWVLNGINGILDTMIKHETYVYDGFTAIRQIIRIAGV